MGGHPGDRNKFQAWQLVRLFNEQSHSVSVHFCSSQTSCLLSSLVYKMYLEFLFTSVFTLISHALSFVINSLFLTYLYLPFVSLLCSHLGKSKYSVHSCFSCTELALLASGYSLFFNMRYLAHKPG